LGDWDGAAQRLRQAAVALSDNPVVTEELGLLFVRVGRCSEALALLRPLVGAAGESEGGAVRRGVATCYLALGDPKSAERVLIDYARRRTDDGHAQLLLAQAALETNDLLTASRASGLAEQSSPGRPAIALLRAAVQWRRNEYAAAAETLYQLLEKAPSNVEAYCLLGEVLRVQGQEDAAQDCFQRALRLDPKSAWALQASSAFSSGADAPPLSSASTARWPLPGQGPKDANPAVRR